MFSIAVHAQYYFACNWKVKGDLLEYSDGENTTKRQGMMSITAEGDFIVLKYTDKLGKKNTSFLQSGTTIRIPKSSGEVTESSLSCKFTRWFKRTAQSANDYCCGAFTPDPKCWTETGPIQEVDNENTIAVTTSVELWLGNKGGLGGTLSGEWTCASTESFTYDFSGTDCK